MRKGLGLLLVGLMIVAQGCTSPDDQPRGGSEEVSERDLQPRQLLARECIRVSPKMAGDLNSPAAQAVAVPIATAPGLARRGTIWFVSDPHGATWVTNVDPQIDQSGLILPLNQKARSTSEMGRDVPSTAPIYAGINNDHVGAIRSRRCAASVE